MPYEIAIRNISKNNHNWIDWLYVYTTYLRSDVILY